jgi:hypothetical protein
MGIPKLAFSPNSLDFGTSVNQRIFAITNSGGGVLTWQASKKATNTWLTITPSTGSVSAGQSTNVTVTVDRANLQPGTYTETIVLTSNGGNGSINVQMAKPGLAFTPTTLSFAGTETVKALTITNSGGGTLTWTASKTQAWLSLSLLSGSLDAGKSAVISVSVNRGALKPGSYQDTIALNSNGGNGQVPVTMLISDPSISVSPTSLAFGTTITQLNMTITNVGGGTLAWLLRPNFPLWLSATPTSGSLDSESSAVVTVTVNRAGMNSGNYSYNINVTSNGGTQIIPVALTSFMRPIM